ncbi:MAG: hypothetical protein A2749_00260 [Parcubacteria group bacterium RIFCSPHIGHO2_01_FULL_45_26]|nr:MAG: hypothetical protein A2749_00260 [Parcubacteria group bacterium RIFCSPHIGHO2_01_FULL_45_26]
MLQQESGIANEGAGKNQGGIPNEVLREFGHDNEALQRITLYAYERLKNALATEDFGDDDERRIWLDSMGDYKKEKGDVPKTTPGWTGHH